MNTLENKNILFCITGSIAAYKTCEIIRNLRKENANVQIAISKAGQKFIGVATLAALSNNKVLTSHFEEKATQNITVYSRKYIETKYCNLWIGCRFDYVVFSIRIE